MHGIHHSFVLQESDSNGSSGLTNWDWLHGKLRLNIPQEEITVGVGALRRPDEVTLPKILAMPFEVQRDPWQLTEDGRVHRENSPSARALLIE